MIPANLSSGRPYRGINILLLNLQQMASGYATNRWLTYQQARALGAQVRRGESGTGIVFFKMLEADGAVRTAHHAANDEPARKVFPMLRSFTVFNASQVDGLPDALTVVPEPPEGWTPIAAAEAVLERSGADIRHGGDRAFYRPADDVIQLPPPAVFPEATSYYNVALHELTHWTSHPDRCNRQLSSRAHLESYAFEELVAEIGSAFLSSHCGLPGEMQHASYISSLAAGAAQRQAAGLHGGFAGAEGGRLPDGPAPRCAVGVCHHRLIPIGHRYLQMPVAVLAQQQLSFARLGRRKNCQRRNAWGQAV